MSYFIGIAIFVLAYGGKFAFQLRPRRHKKSGFEYIYVDDDGTARELSSGVKTYLNTKFRGDDGARPYIKWNYKARTPDERLSGFLKRRLLPSDIPIDSARHEQQRVVRRRV